MSASRSSMNRRKRKRRRQLILSIVVVLFLSLIGYVAFGFVSGKRAAEEDITNAQQGNDAPTKEKEKEYEEEFQGQENNKNKTNILILGVDSRGESLSRTDTIMLAQYDRDNDTAKLASIMRDTYVNIPGYGYNKINSAYFFGGPELLRKTIKENFNIEVQFYAIVDFQGFVQIVDTIAPDGIKMNVEKRMVYQDGAGTININLYPGVQNLSGSQLLDYARFRNDSESDFGRVRRQQQVVGRVKDKLVSFTGIMKLPEALGRLTPYITTNMKSSKIATLAGDFILNPVDQINTMRIPVEGSFWDESHDQVGAVLAIDEAKNREAIQDFFNGE